MSLRTRLLLGSALLVACDSGTEARPGPDPTATLLTTVQWSGGRVQVQSEGFSTLDTFPAFTIGDDTLAVTQLPAGLLELLLPELPSGDYPLLMRADGDSVAVGTVAVVGFSGVSFHTPGFAPNVELMAGQRGDTVVVVGDGVGWDHVVAFTPATGVAESFSGLSSLGGYAIGVSYLGDEFILRDSSGLAGLWQLWPAKTRIGGLPFSGQRQAARVSATGYLYTDSHAGWFRDSTHAITAGPFDYESPWAVFLSPRGDRTLASSVSSQPLVPVIDAATGGTAYELAGTKSLSVAAFSPDGAILYAAASGRPLADDSLRSFDASTGAALLATGVPGGNGVLGMTTSSDGSRLYLMQLRGGRCAPRLLVVETATLALAGAAAVPEPVAGLVCGAVGFHAPLVVDEAAGKLWMTWPGDPFPVFEFDLLP